jgi:hypothetical protein
MQVIYVHDGGDLLNRDLLRASVPKETMKWEHYCDWTLHREAAIAELS